MEDLCGSRREAMISSSFILVISEAQDEFRNSETLQGNIGLYQMKQKELLASWQVSIKEGL